MRIVPMAVVAIGLSVSFAAAQPAETILLSAGPAVPRGVDSNFYDVGLNIGAALQIPMAQRVMLQGAASYHRLGLDYDGILKSLQRTGTGDSVSGGPRAAMALMANLKVMLAGGGNSSVYVLGGLGLNRSHSVYLHGANITSCRGEWAPVATAPSFKLAFNLGVGASIVDEDGFGLFAQGIVTRLSGEGTVMNVLPIQFGISIPWVR